MKNIEIQKSKTIVCNPLDYDKKFNNWLLSTTQEYRNSLDKKNIFCHQSFFNILINSVIHDNNNHYILYSYNDGGIANMPDDEDGD